MANQAKIIGTIVRWGTVTLPQSNSETFGFFDASGTGAVTNFSTQSSFLTETGDVDDLRNLVGDITGVDPHSTVQNLEVDLLPFWDNATDYETHRTGVMVAPERGDFLQFEGDPISRMPEKNPMTGAHVTDRNYPFLILQVAVLSGNKSFTSYRVTATRSKDHDLSS